MTAAVLTAAVMAASVAGCELIASVDRSLIEGTGAGGTGGGGGSVVTSTASATTTGTGGTGGGTTTSTSSTSTSTSTGGGTCVDPTKDCPPPASECVTASCDANKMCAVDNVPVNGPVTTQTAGDCKKVVCDGNGATKTVDDDADKNDDGNDCTTDTCMAGAPVHTPLAIKTACGAGGALKCDATGNCVGCVDAGDCGGTPPCKVNTCIAGMCGTANAADASACSDGNMCTQTDTCMAGNCVGANPVVCTATDQCHTTGTCATANGICSASLPKGDGAACNDGNACTQTDACMAGVCTGSSAIVCTALDQCHAAGTCNMSTGVCSTPAKADGSACTDGNSCTQTDTCQSGACVGASPVTCTAMDECHDIGTCSIATGMCSTPTMPNGTPCGVGGTKMCTNGMCM